MMVVVVVEEEEELSYVDEVHDDVLAMKLWCV
jgi:hypothetical protein